MQSNESYIRKLTEQLNRIEERVSALMEFLSLAMKNSAMIASGMAGAAEDFLRMGEMMHGPGRGMSSRKPRYTCRPLWRTVFSKVLSPPGVVVWNVDHKRPRTVTGSHASQDQEIIIHPSQTRSRKDMGSWPEQNPTPETRQQVAQELSEMFNRMRQDPGHQVGLFVALHF